MEELLGRKTPHPPPPEQAVIGSMLICEMAAYYRSIGSSIKERLEEIYKQYGRYLNKVDSFEFPA